jgi:hypothetical protein
LNLPIYVDRTRRDRMPALLGNMPDVVMPQTVLVDTALLSAPDLADHLQRFDLRFPILVRPLGSHGGEGILFAETLDQLRGFKTPDPQVYLTQFHDTRGSDGYFRKFRMIFVDGKVLPYHLAISRKWLVHYFSADMMAEPWKREEESRFLLSHETALGARAMRGLQAICERLALDFGGIDFTVLDDGRVLVFEANATMAVHLSDKIDDFPYKHQSVPRIFEAVEEMLARHSGT